MILDVELEPAAADLDHLDELRTAAEKAAVTGETSEFYRVLRTSDLAFLPKRYSGDPAGLFRSTVTLSHRIGQHSPGLALGVSQHLASLWAFDLTRALTSRPDRLSATVSGFLDDVFARRLLIANTTSQAGSRRIGEHGSRIRRSGDSFVVEGRSTYMSLATEADKITFLTRDSEGAAIGVITELSGNPALKVSEDLLFGEHLVLADTRRVRFDEVVVPAEDVVGPDARLDTFYLVQLICQNLCVAALNLGGAHRILEETKAFGLESTLPDGTALATSGSFSADVGRLALVYVNALALLLSCAGVVEEVFTTGPTVEAAAYGLQKAIAIKHDVARGVEAVASECRKIVGARSFMAGHPIGRISGEILFGALGPMTEKGIEREFGERYLGA